jgi:hypothetical protein
VWCGHRDDSIREDCEGLISKDLAVAASTSNDAVSDRVTPLSGTHL